MKRSTNLTKEEKTERLITFLKRLEDASGNKIGETFDFIFTLTLDECKVFWNTGAHSLQYIMVKHKYLLKVGNGKYQLQEFFRAPLPEMAAKLLRLIDRYEADYQQGRNKRYEKSKIQKQNVPNELEAENTFDVLHKQKNVRPSASFIDPLDFIDPLEKQGLVIILQQFVAQQSRTTEGTLHLVAQQILKRLQGE